ncbi:MAG TPA: LOG family protein, partial [bacterium]|nr:LOG family protein [bacterium]
YAADKLILTKPSAAGVWREALIRRLASENRLAEMPQYTRFIDRALFMSTDPENQASMKKEWFKKVDRFISNLRHLQHENKLTPESVMRLASSQTAQVWTAIPFVRTRYPSEWLQHDTPSLPSRSEVRISQPVFPWKLRAAGPFLKGFYEKMVRSRIPIEIEGWENLPPDGKFILVANHFSLFDGLIIAFEIYLRTGNLVRFIAKPKFLDFFQNLLIWLGAAIKVEYGKTTKKVEEALQQHWSVGFFPGRRVAPDPAFAFKGWKSTFSELSIKYKKPIIPIAISGNMPGTILDLHAIQYPASQLRFKIRIGRPISWETAGTDKAVSVLEEETKKAISVLLTGENIGLLDGEGGLVRGGKFTGKEEQESDRGEENELVDDPARSEVRGRPSFSLNGHTSDDIRKLIDSVNRERERAYLEAAKRQPAIVVYGSARVPEDHRYYKLGVDLGGKLWDYSRKTGLPLPPRTGAGMSLMDAPLKGYRKARGERKKTPLNLTQGVRIELPFEAEISPNIEVGNGEIKPYKYFLIRKTSLHENSLGAIALPGGYGTLDEVFESWRRHRPLVLLDEEFWTPIINAYYNAFENAGFAKKITNRPLITSSIDTAIKYILEESEKNPPFKPDRTRLAAIKEEFETSLKKLYSMPRSVVFVGRPDPVGNGKELKIAVGLADYLTTRYKVPVRLASRGPLFQRFHKKSIAHQWGNLMQAVLRVPENLPLEVEERIIKKNGQTVIVRDQSNSQFLTSSNAYAYVFLPGMQGTQNRLMDLATLIQTGKA